MEVDPKSTPFHLTLKQLEVKINRKSRQSIFLLILLVAYLSLILIYDPVLDYYIRAILTGIFIIFSLVCVGYSFHWGRNGRRFIYNLRILDLLTPPNPVILSRTAVIDRFPIYIISKWGTSWLFFVRILEPEHVQKESIRLPRFLTRYHTKHQVQGIPVARIESDFSFPAGERECIIGEGILYALPLERDFWRPRKNPISTKILMNIIKQLTLDQAKEI